MIKLTEIFLAKKVLLSGLLTFTCLVVVVSCSVAPSQPPAQTPTATEARSTVTPTASATPTLTVTPTATPTNIPTATTTPTPTITNTPSITSTATRTPTRTPFYNQKGLYPVNRCVPVSITYSSNLKATEELCVASVEILPDYTMKFNIIWHLLTWDSKEYPSRYIYGNNDYMYVMDDLGNYYVSTANSGRAVDNDEPGAGENRVALWYLFQPPYEHAKTFTLTDAVKKVSIGGIVLLK